MVVIRGTNAVNNKTDARESGKGKGVTGEKGSKGEACEKGSKGEKVQKKGMAGKENQVCSEFVYLFYQQISTLNEGN